MADTNSVQQELLALDWRDFSSYPKQGQRMMIHAEGFDTNERVHKHCFFELESFDMMNFPTDEMLQTLNQHHCKWTYQWFPAKIK